MEEEIKLAGKTRNEHAQGCAGHRKFAGASALAGEKTILRTFDNAY